MCSRKSHCVFAMMLVDRGKIALDDPISKYIPSFAAMKVGVERKGATGKAVLDMVPPRRPVMIEDLLLHTSGIWALALALRKIPGLARMI
jgi:CubicO group peptidase (beta-lactamase class C family)